MYTADLPAGPQQDFKSHRLPVAILLFISFWSLFYNVGVIEIDSMEARNLVAAREILQNDNWLIPTMNGEIRLAKPPLPTWLAAIVSKLAGGTDSLTLLRIPNAVSALLLILITYGFTWTLSRDRTLAFMAAAMLATNILLMRVGQRATWDIYCHSFMLGALWALVDGIRNRRGWPLFALAGLLLGLSFLSKGPVAFFALLLPCALSYLWVFGSGEIGPRWRLLVLALIVGIFISSLWPFYIWYFHPEALLKTAGTETHSWINRHVKPPGYYLEFPVYSGLWLTLVLAAFIKPFADKRVASIQDYRFFLVWLGLEIVLLSLLPEKKTRYLLPAMIPMALLGAALLRGIMERYRQLTEQKWDRRIVLLHGSIPTLLGTVLCAGFFYQLRLVGAGGNPWFFIPVLAIYLSLIVGGWYLLKNRNLLGHFTITAMQYCLLVFLYMSLYLDVGITNPEYKSMAGFDVSELPEKTEIFLKERRGSGIKYVWDLNTKIRYWNVAAVKSELESGRPVVVIAASDSYREIASKISENVELEIIGSFDYNENRPQKRKTLLVMARIKK